MNKFELKPVYCWLIVLTVIGACKEPPAQPASQPQPAEKATLIDTASPSPGAPENKQRPAPIRESAVRDLFSDWLKSQNEGDFQQYAALYAQRFDGIKRAGRKTFRYDRKGWLEDREKMFKKKMTVAADDLKIQAGTVTARVSFIQTWSNGRFSDKGPKVLQLFLENGNLRIFNEEMLQSDMAKRKGKIKPPEFLDSFYLTTDDNYAVLGNMSASTGPGDITHTGGYIAIKSLHPQEGQSAFRMYVAGGIWVGYADGSVENTQITDIVGLAKNVFHFGVPQMWAEENYTAAQEGVDIWTWASTNDNLYYAAKLPPKNIPAIWAARNLGKEIKVFQPFKPTSTERTAVLSALLSTPESQVLQTQFEKGGQSGNWHEYEERSIVIKGFADGTHNRFIYAQVSAGRGCGDFYGTVYRFFNIATGVPTDLGAPTEDDFFLSSFVDSYAPDAAIDLDGDEFPEFVGKEKLMYKSGNTWYVHELRIPWGDCPC
ncbi:MAG: nuclear transport factor 2 family protein [Deltaproteobacteria bacterium]|nr:nuclear transport factor 2 family protein [Deltaproteobacteria bacterium]